MSLGNTAHVLANLLLAMVPQSKLLKTYKTKTDKYFSDYFVLRSYGNERIQHFPMDTAPKQFNLQLPSYFVDEAS